MLLENNTIFFIHIPRTSGTNFEKILGFNDHHKWGEGNMSIWFGLNKKLNIMLQHATISQIMQYDPDIISNKIIITIIRNPITRIYSLYNYFKNFTNFDSFLEYLENGEINHYFFQPQYQYLQHNNELIECDIIYFENFRNDLTKIKEKYNFEIEINFDENKQKDKLNKILNILNDEQIKRIKILYEKDFELFGYN